MGAAASRPGTGSSSAATGSATSSPTRRWPRCWRPSLIRVQRRTGWSSWPTSTVDPTTSPWSSWMSWWVRRPRDASVITPIGARAGAPLVVAPAPAGARLSATAATAVAAGAAGTSAALTGQIPRRVRGREPEPRPASPASDDTQAVPVARATVRSAAVASPPLHARGSAQRKPRGAAAAAGHSAADHLPGGLLHPSGGGHPGRAPSTPFVGTPTTIGSWRSRTTRSWSSRVIRRAFCGSIPEWSDKTKVTHIGGARRRRGPDPSRGAGAVTRVRRSNYVTNLHEEYVRAQAAKKQSQSGVSGRHHDHHAHPASRQRRSPDTATTRGARQRRRPPPAAARRRTVTPRRGDHHAPSATTRPMTERIMGRRIRWFGVVLLLCFGLVARPAGEHPIPPGRCVGQLSRQPARRREGVRQRAGHHHRLRRDGSGQVGEDDGERQIRTTTPGSIRRGRSTPASPGTTHFSTALRASSTSTTST